MNPLQFLLQLGKSNGHFTLRITCFNAHISNVTYQIFIAAEEFGKKGTEKNGIHHIPNILFPNVLQFKR
jgi:hypothetical protein